MKRVLILLIFTSCTVYNIELCNCPEEETIQPFYYQYIPNEIDPSFLQPWEPPGFREGFLLDSILCDTIFVDTLYYLNK